MTLVCNQGLCPCDCISLHDVCGNVVTGDDCSISPDPVGWADSVVHCAQHVCCLIVDEVQCHVVLDCLYQVKWCILYLGVAYLLICYPDGWSCSQLGDCLA